MFDERMRWLLEVIGDFDKLLEAKAQAEREQTTCHFEKELCELRGGKVFIVVEFNGHTAKPPTQDARTK